MAVSPHPANVSGDFYVEEGCCTLCEVPFTEAADLFGWWPSSESPKHCYVKRQPENKQELDSMVMAIRCAELQCIHYRGSDLGLQLHLVQLGEGMVCDNLPPDLKVQAEAMEAESLRQYRSGQSKQQSWWRRMLEWWGGHA